MAESMGNFFTPMDSPTHSDSEDDHMKSPKVPVTPDDDFLLALITLPSLTHDKVCQC